MAKGKLSEAVKTFIVQSLACFDSPSVVAEERIRREDYKAVGGGL